MILFDSELNQEVSLVSDHCDMLIVETKEGKRYTGRTDRFKIPGISCFSPEPQPVVEPVKETIEEERPTIEKDLKALIKSSAPAPKKKSGAQIKLF